MSRSRLSRFRRIFWIAGLSVLALIVILPIAALIYLRTADLRALTQRMASDELGRAVTVGDLRLDWGRTLKLEIRDLRVGNAEWGKSPDMMRIGRLTAVVYLPALLRGIVQYDILRLEGSELFLERKNDGARNWRFGDEPSVAASAVKKGGLALVPKNRRQFPDVKDLLLSDLLIVYRSEGRDDIRIRLDESSLGAPDAATGVRMSARGAYNDIPLQLAVTGGSYQEMRDAAQPFPTAFAAESGATKIDFKGGIAEPLDFDGVAGALKLDVGDFAAFLKMFGYERPMKFPVRLAGDMTRDGDRWALAKTQGKFKDSTVGGNFVFIEGARGKPDAAEVDVDLDRFDVKTLAEGIAEPDSVGATPESFRPEDEPSTTLKARIAAKQVSYGDIRVEDFRLDGEMMPGALTMKSLGFAFAGGKADASGALRGDGPKSATATVAASYAGGDAARLAKMAGLDDGLLSGALDGRVSLAMTGPTLEKALAASEGQAVIAMRGGEISRSLLEKVSLDLRSIFRRNSQSTAIQCLLVVADIQKGSARILPLTLRTPETRLVGGGALDMPSGQLDLLVRSDPKSTGGLALDLPLHVTGPLDSPSVSPRLGAAPAWLTQPQALPAGLDAPARALAAETGCAP